eukprot:Hpha_TRINITY_DN24154_c0_g1::TRINITY_DN24154_c0_g1_i1::g.9804::m.9804
MDDLCAALARLSTSVGVCNHPPRPADIPLLLVTPPPEPPAPRVGRAAGGGPPPCGRLVRCSRSTPYRTLTAASAPRPSPPLAPLHSGSDVGADGLTEMFAALALRCSDPGGTVLGPDAATAGAQLFGRRWCEEVEAARARVEESTVGEEVEWFVCPAEDPDPSRRPFRFVATHPALDPNTPHAEFVPSTKCSAPADVGRECEMLFKCAWEASHLLHLRRTHGSGALRERLPASSRLLTGLTNPGSLTLPQIPRPEMRVRIGGYSLAVGRGGTIRSATRCQRARLEAPSEERAPGDAEDGVAQLARFAREGSIEPRELMRSVTPQWMRRCMGIGR